MPARLPLDVRLELGQHGERPPQELALLAAVGRPAVCPRSGGFVDIGAHP